MKYQQFLHCVSCPVTVNCQPREFKVKYVTTKIESDTMNRNLAIFLIFIMKLKSVKADAQRSGLCGRGGIY
jgi:hypothetical protein